MPFEPAQAVLHVGTAFPCRVLVNGAEIGRQGGFDPYGLMMRVQRYTTDAFGRGTNTLVLEATDTGEQVALVADVRLHGADGEEVTPMSGPDWTVCRDEGLPAPVAVRRQQGEEGPAGERVVANDPPANNVWRRPHPLPLADWLEDTPSDGTVLPVVPDAFPGQDRVEWFRWTLPPGALEMHLPVSGRVSAGVDGAEVPVVGGAVTLSRSDASRREVRLRVEPEPGRSEGSVFGGPVTYRMGLGPIQLGDWAEQGLEDQAYPQPFRVLWVGTLINHIGEFVVLLLGSSLISAWSMSVTQVSVVLSVLGVGRLVAEALAAPSATVWA